MDKEVIKFIKKNKIIQEFASTGNLSLIRIEDMLHKFQKEERKRILKRLSKDDIYNSHVGFAISKLEEFWETQQK